MSISRPFRDARHIRDDLDGLAASLDRLAARPTRIEVRADTTGDGWQRCSDLLADPDGFRRWRETLADWLRGQYRIAGPAPGRTTACYVMAWYLRAPAYAAALLLHQERRVPSLRPQALALRTAPRGRPELTGAAVLDNSFYCLPLDPGAARPEATVVADEQQLAAVLRAGYVAHAARFVRAFGRVSPVGAHTLWAAATDALDTCLWWAGADSGDEGAGVAEAALVLGSRYPPLTSPSTLHLRQAASGRRWTRSRESCCFSYLLPGRDECEGCPRLRPKPDPD
ncbi:FhuF 2Fe-2S C-terminal domain protein [Saccharomonospora marina XMU15]|uniref:FhuF 2Fe-2S C-terminal domain protein n=1 Tax=Saccharomonospora marina XMU15 TaxID=882083 RepID=H5X209_9PSEU|nr:(2Fe-2S)-binding protein [Saccharomonospora marina]EHR53138.1 FhuF 2Fe-2S C-terminal domain protein [Saccharomonospora marina XMU15]